MPNLLSDNVAKYDGVTGAFIGVFASGSGLDRPVGLAFGPDSNLYVASSSNSRILRYDGITGDFLGIFATTRPGPEDIVFGADGNLYVANSVYPGDIVRFNEQTGSFVDTFTANWNIGYPIQMVFHELVPEPTTSVLLLWGSLFCVSTASTPSEMSKPR